MQRQLTFIAGLLVGMTTMWFTDLLDQFRGYGSEPFDT